MSHIHIDIENLNFSYDSGKEVLKNINIHAREQDSIGIIGANGVGKSTFLKLLVGLNMNFTGSIRVEEIPLEKLTLARIREKIGYIFQDSDSQLFMTTVESDVAFGPRNYGLPESEVRARVGSALQAVGIEHLRTRQIHKLSGGEKRLVAIATILSMHPDIILLDEPEAALDPRNRRNLINVLNGIDHLKFIASHDLDFIMDTCNRTILMNDGQIIADDKTEVILTDKELLESCNLELPLSMQRRWQE